MPVPCSHVLLNPSVVACCRVSLRTDVNFLVFDKDAVGKDDLMAEFVWSSIDKLEKGADMHRYMAAEVSTLVEVVRMHALLLHCLA